MMDKRSVLNTLSLTLEAVGQIEDAFYINDVETVERYIEIIKRQTFPFYKKCGGEKRFSDFFEED